MGTKSSPTIWMSGRLRGRYSFAAGDGHREPLARVTKVIAAARGGTPADQRKVGNAAQFVGRQPHGEVAD